MCGGNPPGGWPGPGTPGLSPRVRGKQRSWQAPGDAAWSIPACAGETGNALVAQRVAAVYPRVCGGNCSRAAPWGRGLGLSPRVRGKHSLEKLEMARDRSIPACAGETQCCRRRECRSRVYPRVCGGNDAGTGPPGDAGGLSPRVRGKRQLIRLYRISLRSIPACAGETPRPTQTNSRRKVYPRVCGGNAVDDALNDLAWGLSPRVRGKRVPFVADVIDERSIPACAGEALRAS